MFEEQRLRQMLGDFQGKTIAVVGDVMIDRYYWGAVHRVSPEAPVPIVEVESESVRFGGAANVANNIESLGGNPFVVGLVGKDHPGEMFLRMLADEGLDDKGIVIDASRPTTIKTRIIAAGQHVVRVDNESKKDCSAEVQAQIIGAVRTNIGKIDGIIIEDYNKGVITKEVIAGVIAAARQKGIPVTVDPKFNNFLEYKNVAVFKPNRREAEDALGGRLRTTEDVEKAGKKLLELLHAENVLITRSEDGMSLFQANGRITHIPTTADVVLDVSGAGDTVVATLTMALVAGIDIVDACKLANLAGGVVVGSVGIVPITPEVLLQAAMKHNADGVR
jgi:D-glycero-beta-D-manno-heptose-7-phosphate kinase